MSEQIEEHQPYWEQPLPEDQELADQDSETREENLLLDVRAPAEINKLLMDPMRRQGVRFWIIFVILGGLVIDLGDYLAVPDDQRPGHHRPGAARRCGRSTSSTSSTSSASGMPAPSSRRRLRALKFEWRRPISRAAEIVTVFGLIDGGHVPGDPPGAHAGRPTGCSPIPTSASSGPATTRPCCGT